MPEPVSSVDDIVRVAQSVEETFGGEVDLVLATQDEEHAMAVEEERDLPVRAAPARFAEGDKVAVSVPSWIGGRHGTFCVGVVCSVPNKETFVYRAYVLPPWENLSEPRCVRVPDEDPDYIRDLNDPETKTLLKRINKQWEKEKNLLPQWLRAKDFMCSGCDNPQCHAHLEHNRSGKFRHPEVVISYFPKDYDFNDEEAVEAHLMPQRSFGNFFGSAYFNTLEKARKALKSNMLQRHPDPFEENSNRIHMNDPRWVPRVLVPKEVPLNIMRSIIAPEVTGAGSS